MKQKVVAIVIGLLLIGTATSTTSALEYQVAKGENIWEIAQEYEVTIDNLRESNQLNTKLIFPGQLLQIDREINYAVKAGETLSEIADAHHVDVNDLKLWNALASNFVLIDQELTIKEVKYEQNKTQTKSIEITAEPEVEEKPEAIEAEKVETDKAVSVSTSEMNGSNQQNETLTMTATAYTAKCTGCSGITATGINLNEDRNKKVIAVDPNVIPLGTSVYVEGYGEAIAGDTGGAIKGNKIDIHVPTKDEAYRWGVRTVQVTILN